MKYPILFTALLSGSFFMANAQQTMKPEETEIWEPVPKVVTPGKHCGDAPSDAIILFDGKNLDNEPPIVASIAKDNIGGVILFDKNINY